MQRQVDRNDGSIELTHIRHSNQAQPQLSDTELERLWNLVAEQPDNKLYVDDQLSYPVLKFNDNTYVVVGKHIGHGFWGQVELGTLYQRQPDSALHGTKCVIKSADKSNPLKNVLHNMLNTPEKMDEESKLVKQIYGMGEFLLTTSPDNNETQTYILQPYLGDLSLTKLLTQTERAKTIPRKEWLRLFSTLIEKLDTLHRLTHCLHNDVKPDNIGISLSEDEDAPTFTQINFFDLGNAHPINGTGAFGDPWYQPPESFFGVALPSIKSEKVDVYALGVTLLEVTNLLLQITDKEDERIYDACKQLFQNMAAVNPSNRPTLTECLGQLAHIAKMCDNTLPQFELEEKEEKNNSTHAPAIFSLSSTQTFFQHLWDYSYSQIQAGTQDALKSMRPEPKKNGCS